MGRKYRKGCEEKNPLNCILRQTVLVVKETRFNQDVTKIFKVGVNLYFGSFHKFIVIFVMKDAETQI